MKAAARAKLSMKNKYYIDKHRYYELKHFCLQYMQYKREYANLDGLCNQAQDDIFCKSNMINDPTYNLAAKRISYFNRMKAIEQSAMKTDPELYCYILKAVTEGLSYTTLYTKYEIPCGKDVYYNRYRKFFWILDKTRD